MNSASISERNAAEYEIDSFTWTPPATMTDRYCDASAKHSQYYPTVI